jgi:predicted aminopeptidase
VRGLAAHLGLAAAALLLSACSPGWALRGAYEEARILASREPIFAVLARPDLDPAGAEKLRLVLVVREYARRLGLDVGGSYRTLAPIGADQRIHMLTAAPRFELRPYTWWFPIVGDMPYKGFFSVESARAAAAALQREGYDTMVQPVAAFSTLGWFDDPLLSNLLEHDDVVLAGIVLHELTHQTYYARGQTVFNESFANFVGARGAIDLFAALDGEAAPRAIRARDLWHDDLLYSAFLGRLTARLRQAYARGITLEERAAIFAEEQAALLELPWQTQSYTGLARVELNNALILQQWVYHTDLEVFEAAYSAQGGDLRAAIAAIIETARDAPDPMAALRAVGVREEASSEDSPPR